MEIKYQIESYYLNQKKINELKAVQETLGVGILSNMNVNKQKKMTIGGKGTFSVVTRKIWDWGDKVKLGMLGLNQLKKDEKESREPDKIKEILRFQIKKDEEE